MHRVWKRTVQTLREGVQLIRTPRGIRNNLPKQSESPVAHVRPHGINALDTLPLPDGRAMTKQCFWLNNTYIAKQITCGKDTFSLGKKRKPVSAVQEKVVKTNSKSELYDSLSPQGQVVADIIEDVVHVATEKIKEKALVAVEKIVTKKK